MHVIGFGRFGLVCRSLTAALILAFVVPLAGCEDDARDDVDLSVSPDSGGAQDAAGLDGAVVPEVDVGRVVEGDGAVPEVDAGPVSCESGGFARSTFAIVEDEVAPEPGVVSYTARSSAVPPYDVIGVDIFEGFENTPVAPGRYVLDGINYRDCGVCVLGFKGCTGDGFCEKELYAQRGTIEISRLPSTGQFTATLEGVVFDEVAIDDETDVSTPVVGGEQWCLDGFAFDRAVENLPSRCHPDVVEGCAQVGEQTEEIYLRSCEDEREVELMGEIGAGRKAIVVVLTAAWCAACSERLPDYVALAAARAAEGLEVVYVLSATADFEAADAQFCRQYAGRYDGARLDRFFFDHDGSKSFPSVFSRLYRYPVGDGTFPLPWIGVIDPRTMTFVYSEAAEQELGGEAFAAVVDRLLAAP